MSSTSLIGFHTNGEMVRLHEYRNAYHGAFLVWIEMGKKYGIPSPETMLFNEGTAKAIWGLATDDKVPEHDRITMMTTFDRAVVMAEHLPRVIAAFNESKSWLPPQCHTNKQIADLEEIMENNMICGEEEKIVAVGWNQTSVVDCWETGELDESQEEYVPYNLLKHTKHFVLFA